MSPPKLAYSGERRRFSSSRLRQSEGPSPNVVDAVVGRETLERVGRNPLTSRPGRPRAEGHVIEAYRRVVHGIEPQVRSARQDHDPPRMILLLIGGPRHEVLHDRAHQETDRWPEM